MEALCLLLAKNFSSRERVYLLFPSRGYTCYNMNKNSILTPNTSMYLLAILATEAYLADDVSLTDMLHFTLRCLFLSKTSGILGLKKKLVVESRNSVTISIMFRLYITKQWKYTTKSIRKHIYIAVTKYIFTAEKTSDLIRKHNWQRRLFLFKSDCRWLVCCFGFHRPSPWQEMFRMSPIYLGYRSECSVHKKSWLQRLVNVLEILWVI
jgi:hypothetical protein